MKKNIIVFCSLFALSFVFFGCTEKSKIDSLADKKNETELIEKINKKLKEKDTTNLVYLCDISIKSQLLKVTELIEKLVLERTFDSSATIQIIESYERNKVGFAKPNEMFSLVINNNSAQNYRLLKTHPKEKTISLVENYLYSFVNRLTDTLGHKQVLESIPHSELTLVNNTVKFYCDYYSPNDSNKFLRLQPILEYISKQKTYIKYMTQPTEPKYVQPEYKGAYYLSGSYVGLFRESSYDRGGLPDINGSPIILNNGQYYQVSGGGGSASYMSFYVEDAGRNVTLDIGRNGVPCKVVYVKDQQTYLDDQRNHQQRLQLSQEIFAKELASYNNALKVYNTNLVNNREYEIEINKAIKQISTLFAINK